MKRDKNTWFIEPFNHEFELWTIGTQGEGFVWLLAHANPELSRCRTLSRREGVEQIRAKYWTEAERCTIVLGGGVGGDEVLLEICTLSLTLGAEDSLIEANALLTRVCARLKELQVEFYDGATIMKSAARGGGYGLFSLLNLLRIGLVDSTIDAWGG